MTNRGKLSSIVIVSCGLIAACHRSETGSGQSASSATPAASASVPTTLASSATAATSPPPKPHASKLAHVACDGAFWVVRPDGDVWAWGSIVATNGKVQKVAAPRAVEGLNNVVRIAPAGDRACALFRDGTVGCWGNTFGGAIARGNHAVPQKLPLEKTAGLDLAKDVQLSGTYGCALVASGEVRCWGMRDDYGIDRTPRAVPELGPAKLFSSGSTQGCAVLEQGSVGCWGLVHGRVWSYGHAVAGQDDSVRDKAYAREVNDAVTVSAAANHACAVTRSGSVWCWGSASFGQLGYGKRGSGPARAEFVPVKVTGIDDATTVAVSDDASCAVRKDGSVWCWGSHARGQLGVEERVGSRVEPARLPNLTDVNRLVTGCGGSAFCAIRNDDTMVCWPRDKKRTPQLVEEIGMIPESR